MNYPDRKTAVNLLIEGEKLNPGQWKRHSEIAAECAEKIAKKCGLDKDRAFINSLLHDIGRREGKHAMRHVIDGYKFLTKLGFDGAARICLTHSFMLKNINEYLGEFDVSDGDLEFLKNYIDTAEYDDYDLLGQLCDYLSHPSGACIAEKRMVDVALRYGVSGLTLDKWRRCLQVKEYFDERCGIDIYKLIL